MNLQLTETRYHEYKGHTFDFEGYQATIIYPEKPTWANQYIWRAEFLGAFDQVDVYLAGGKMRQSGSLVDSLATEFIGRMHFDLCFLTGAGLTADFGLSNGTDETAAFQRKVLQNSRKKILLLPGSKIGTDSFIKVCDAAVFDTVITDWECLDEHVRALEDLGVETIVVQESE